MLQKIKTWAIQKLNRQVSAKTFYSYEDIPLRLYLRIASTGKLGLLAKKRTYIPTETLVGLWEALVNKNGHGGTKSTLDYYRSLEESYGLMLSDYTALKATLTKLMIRYNEDDAAFMASKRCKLAPFKNSQQYHESLSLANKKIENIATHMRMNRKELAKFKNENAAVDLPTFEQLIANLSIHLPFEIKDDITLIRYNEYKKLIQDKHKKSEKISMEE